MHFLRFAALALLALPVAAASQDYNAAFIGHVWANQPSNPGPYTPDLFYSHNAADGAISITRASVGNYTVQFAGLAAAATESTVQVAPYAITASDRCVLGTWSAVGADLRVSVRCFEAGTGLSTDSQFTVLVAKANDATSGLGYVWANDDTAPAYTPDSDYSHNGSGGDISITRSAAGSYRVRFAGMGEVANSGTVQVSSYALATSVRATCLAARWMRGGDDLLVDIRCVDATGVPTDYRYTVLFVPSGTQTPGLGFAWADDASAAGPYVPDASYSYNGSGGGVTVNRSSTGRYSVTFDGLGQTGIGGTALVTGYGRTASGVVEPVVCLISAWLGVPDLVASVRCEAPDGTPTDARFSVLTARPGLAPVANEGGPGVADGLTLEPPAPMPAHTETRLTYALARAATIRLTVYDALGREVARPAEGAMAAGRHTVSLATASLPAGVYVVRLEGDGRVATRRLIVAR